MYAQSSMPLVGYLNGAVLNAAFVESFNQGLAEHGYAENRNVTVEYKWALVSI